MKKAINAKLKSAIYDLLDSSPKNLTDKTKNSYYQRLKWVKDNLDLETTDPKKIVSNVDQITELLDKSDIALTSKSLTANQMKQLADLLNLSQPIKDKYNQVANAFTGMSDASRRTNKLEGKKAERFVSWDELKGVYEKMPEDTFNQIQDKIICGLYTGRFPGVLRLDFASVKTYNSIKTNRDENWFLKGKGKYTFYLNKYKTTGKYGGKVLDITDEDFIRLLDKWFNTYNKSDWFLVSYRDHEEPLNETSLSRRIMHIFEKQTGKKVNNGLLRIAVESDIINDPTYKDLSLNEQIALHEKQLHSFFTSHEYLKK